MQVGRLEVMQQLSLVDFTQTRRRLQFQEHAARNQNVRTVGHVEQASSVQDSQFDLAFEGDVSFFQLNAQGLLVCSFEKTGAKFAVDPLGGANNRIGQRIVVGSRCNRWNRWFGGHKAGMATLAKSTMVQPLAYGCATDATSRGPFPRPWIHRYPDTDTRANASPASCQAE